MSIEFTIDRTKVFITNQALCFDHFALEGKNERKKLLREREQQGQISTYQLDPIRMIHHV